MICRRPDRSRRLTEPVGQVAQKLPLFVFDPVKVLPDPDGMTGMCRLTSRAIPAPITICKFIEQPLGRHRLHRQQVRHQH